MVYHKVNVQKLSNAQVMKMLKGQRIRIKHGQGGHELHLSNEQTKKLAAAHRKGAGITMEMDPYQISLHEHLMHKSGGIISTAGKAFSAIAKSPMAKSIAKAVVPIATNVVKDLIDKKLTGSGRRGGRRGRGVVDTIKNVAKSPFVKDIVSHTIPIATNVVKQMIDKKLTGSGGRRGGRRGRGMDSDSDSDEGEGFHHRMRGHGGDSGGHTNGKKEGEGKKKRGGSLYGGEGGALFAAGHYGEGEHHKKKRGKGVGQDILKGIKEYGIPALSAAAMFL